MIEYTNCLLFHIRSGRAGSEEREKGVKGMNANFLER